LIAVCGSTALSATLYPRGRTAHSLFGIPVTEDSTELHSRVMLRSGKANYLKGLDLIVWEELPMSNKACVECTSKLMQDITGSSEPFGGKVVVALGDFREVAPVVKDGGPSAVFDASIRSSRLWKSFQILSLTQPIRNAMDPEFSAWVDEIGEGSEGPQVHLPSRFITKLFDPEDAIHFLFPPSLLHDYQSLAKRSFLTPLNIHVDAFNTRMLELINGNVRTYHSFDSVKEDELSAGSAQPPEMTGFLSMATEPGIPSHTLRLKENSLCSLMRNISIDSGLVKNARVIVR